MKKVAIFLQNKNKKSPKGKSQGKDGPQLT